MYLTLKSGRVICLNRGFIGINKELEICEGYDGRLSYYSADPHDAGRGEAGDHFSMFTQEEREEIANYAIMLWNAFKDKKKETK